MIPLFDSASHRVNPNKEEVSQDLSKKLFSLSIEADALKSLQDIQEFPYNKETNDEYVMRLNDQINFMKKENKTNNAKIHILSENQNCFSK